MDDVRLEIFNLANIFLAGIDGTIIPFYDNNINNDINNIYINNIIIIIIIIYIFIYWVK